MGKKWLSLVIIFAIPVLGGAWAAYYLLALPDLSVFVTIWPIAVIPVIITVLITCLIFIFSGHFLYGRYANVLEQMKIEDLENINKRLNNDLRKAKGDAKEHAEWELKERLSELEKKESELKTREEKVFEKEVYAKDLQIQAMKEKEQIHLKIAEIQNEAQDKILKAQLALEQAEREAEVAVNRSRNSYFAAERIKRKAQGQKRYKLVTQ
jgi:hypothetical protein